MGFKKENGFSFLAHLDNDERCIETISANEELFGGKAIQADLQNFDEYLYSDANNLASLVSEAGGVDLILGGPPCQAYSLAGRVRDPNGMNFDPRNYLFESYVEVVKCLQPKYFLFENVTGMLSATPNGIDIKKAIFKSFDNIDYEISTNFDECVFNVADFGVPQNRKRVILFGVNRRFFKKKTTERITMFYSFLEKKKDKRMSVSDAISDLPKIFPLPENVGKISHKAVSFFPDHEPRFHSARDIKIFRLLAEDALKQFPIYKNIAALKELYFSETGKRAEVHKYFVLPNDGVSNTIPAHLYKDGLRHIHPDPNQARSITVREAARLQSFPDPFQFIGSQTDKYKMIGNAVPPKFSIKLAQALMGLEQ